MVDRGIQCIGMVGKLTSRFSIVRYFVVVENLDWYYDYQKSGCQLFQIENKKNSVSNQLGQYL